MGEQYYVLRLWEPAVPAFVSFERMYVGTEADIRKAMAAMTAENVSGETVDACNRYFAGDTTATHNLCYRDIPVLEPAELIRSSIMTIGEQNWEHINAWNYPYYVKCDGADIERLVIKYKDKYYRCFRASFKNLSYRNTLGNWSTLDSFFLGNAFLLDIERPNQDEFIMTNMLFEVESEHKTLEEADSIDNSDNIDFKTYCDEIFGDG